VAGVGTRLRPHTLSKPKPLLRVAEKTILSYVLDPLLALNPEEVIFVIGHKGSQIRQFVEENYDFKATFVWQDRLLGLGYAVQQGLLHVGDGPVLVILGDTIVECDLKELIRHKENILGVRQVDDPQRFGVAEVKDGMVVSLQEKPAEPRTNLALIGLYYFYDSSELKQALNDLVVSGRRTRGEIQLTDALETMIDNGARFRAFEVKQWYDCGKKEAVLATNRHFLMKLPPTSPPEGVTIVPPVYIAPGAKVSESVIGPYVSIADGAEVHRCIIKNSIISTGASIDNAVIERSLVGMNTTVKGTSQVLNVGDSSEVDYD